MLRIGDVVLNSQGLVDSTSNKSPKHTELLGITLLSKYKENNCTN